MPSMTVLSMATPQTNTDIIPIKAGVKPCVTTPNNTVKPSTIITLVPSGILKYLCKINANISIPPVLELTLNTNPKPMPTITPA